VAKIDLDRRAAIGRAKSAKTREQLLGAARSLYAQRAVEAVTVEDVVREAELAKGTFYIHFKNIEAIQMAVADELAEAFVTMLQPRRTIVDDPVERIADGCLTFMHQAVLNPAWGSLVARYAWSFPTVGGGAREMLADDLRRAARQKFIGSISFELASAIVVGVVLNVMRSASEGNLRTPDVANAVIAILLALGASRRKAESALKRVVQEIKSLESSASKRSTPDQKRRPRSA
jgi:AcrR family transcriptional regulator